jgi:hypothetical protein
VNGLHLHSMHSCLSFVCRVTEMKSQSFLNHYYLLQKPETKKVHFVLFSCKREVDEHSVTVCCCEHRQGLPELAWFFCLFNHPDTCATHADESNHDEHSTQDLTLTLQF